MSGVDVALVPFSGCRNTHRLRLAPASRNDVSGLAKAGDSLKPGILWSTGNAPQMAKDNRPSAARRGYGYRWKRARAEFLSVNPLCVTILPNGTVCNRPATTVDHNRPIDPKLGSSDPIFWVQGNWRPRCQSCHNRKTKTNDNAPLMDAMPQLSLLAIPTLEHTALHQRQTA